MRRNKCLTLKELSKILLALMGGLNKLFAFFDKDFMALSRAMGTQDTEIIGRILRCHLFVEHFITEYLTIKIPDVNLDEARLTFTQKTPLVRAQSNPCRLIPPSGNTCDNTIRNRLSHTLKGEISKADVSFFTDIHPISSHAS